MSSVNLTTPKNSYRLRRGLLLGLVLLAILGGAGYLASPQLLAWYRWRAAQGADDRRDFTAAHTLYVKCLQAWPKDVATHLAAARAARRAGLLDEADDHIRICQRLEGDVSEETTLEYTLLEAKRNGLTPAQEKYLHGSLQQDRPDALYILEVLTDDYMRHERLPEALPLLDFWLQRRPDDLEALLRRGWVSDHLQDFPSTRLYYEKALAIDPGRDSVRLRLAEILVDKKRAGEAREHLEQLRARKPDDPAVGVAYARCLDQLGQVREAGLILDELLRQRPADPQLLSERGKIALAQDSPAQAEIFLRRALKLAPRDRQVIYNMTECLERQGKKAEARKYSELLKNIDADIKTVGKLIPEVMRDPHNADLRYQVGAVFLKNGQIDEAMRWFATALEEDKFHRATHEALADYYERTGNQDRGTKHRQILETLRPKP